MASVLTDFTKKREFLVCMDSDGCVMDTVSIKHTIVMCPELIRVFALDDHADFVASAWEEINLRNITRGLSRFESVVLVFDRLKNRGIEVPGSEDISAWVNTSAELSTASLQHELLRTGSLALRKLQEWNNACNRRIQALEPTFEPFPGVEESLRQLHAVADLAVVSAAMRAPCQRVEALRAGPPCRCHLRPGGGQQGQLHRHHAGLRVREPQGADGGRFDGRCPGRRREWRRLCADPARPRGRQLAPLAGGSPAEAAARHLQPGIPGRTAGRPAQCPARVIFTYTTFSRRHPCDGVFFMLY